MEDQESSRGDQGLKNSGRSPRVRCVLTFQLPEVPHNTYIDLMKKSVRLLHSPQPSFSWLLRLRLLLLLLLLLPGHGLYDFGHLPLDLFIPFPAEISGHLELPGQLLLSF